ncbi:O-antigen ligase family protein [Stutzerimonas kunmingensis]|uniref:O-antigen ligase family protein n=1 Tax=Stutzerimonas kunmingensis TaxID=1211807 RepID=UPI0028B12CB3|nr:O-antigen ligase family protein [Stutzerimonas kunmingensis]
MKVASAIGLSILLVLFAAFCASAVETWHIGYGWHDQQRIYQLFFIVTSVLLAAFLPQSTLPRLAQLLLLGLFILGLCSSLLSDWPAWALKEWARYAGLTLLALLIGGLAQRSAVREVILWAIAIVGFIHAFQFLIFYLMAFTTGIRMLNVDILFNGFANPRFFGQFQVMLLPALAFMIIQCNQKQRSGIASLLFMALVTQWCIAFSLGGRGLWLGLLVGHGTVVLINHKLWRIPTLQIASALVGLLIFLLLFKLIPLWQGIDPSLRDSLRVGLSGREYVWQWAWDMAIANPWLGVGPMHYSATYNPIAAHPHQVVLQWLAEWGFAATSIALILGGWGLVHGSLRLRKTTNELDAGLWVAIVGAMVLAQVDGVFVMPYSETWLAILIGLALSRWANCAPVVHSQRAFTALLAIPVVLILARVLLVEAPALPRTEEEYLRHNAGGKPRFWQQGWIPMDPAIHSISR